MQGCGWAHACCLGFEVVLCFMCMALLVNDIWYTIAMHTILWALPWLPCFLESIYVDLCMFSSQVYLVWFLGNQTFVYLPSLYFDTINEEGSFTSWWSRGFSLLTIKYSMSSCWNTIKICWSLSLYGLLAIKYSLSSCWNTIKIHWSLSLWNSITMM